METANVIVTKRRKTHLVLDLVYTPDEGQDCFAGTEQECNDYVAEQKNDYFMYQVVLMTEQELKEHNRE